MATTVSAIQTKLNSLIHDTTTNSVSAAERLSAISIACQETITAIGLPMTDASYALSFFDEITKYNITSSVPGYMESVDLLRETPEQTVAFSRLSPREIYVDIDSNYGQEPTFAVELLDGNTYLVINAQAQYPAIPLHDCDSLTNNGTWAADTTTSDAASLTADTYVYKQGSGSLKFNATVAQSGNNRATISISDMDAVDLSDLNSIGSLLFWVWIPESTNFSSVTAYWGSSSTAYYSGAATTDVTGAAFVEGAWNLLKVDWASASTTSTPDASAINYLRFDFNYTAGYTNQTGFRLDYVRMVRPETMTLKYQSSYIGTSAAGAKLFAFTATSDIPFYSGQYDHLDNLVSCRAAGILFDQMGLFFESDKKNSEWQAGLAEVRKRFPATRITERNSFKVGTTGRHSIRRRRASLR